MKKYLLFIALVAVVLISACGSDTNAPLPVRTVDNSEAAEGHRVIELADARNIQLQPGETVTFTWKAAPANADRYDFVVEPLDGSMPVVLGMDTDSSDGASTEWQVLSGVSGQLVALAYFPDGRVVESGPGGTIDAGQ